MFFPIQADLAFIRLESGFCFHSDFHVYVIGFMLINEPVSNFQKHNVD